MKSSLAVCCFVLTSFIFISAVSASPFSKYEYQKEYENFVKRITGDLRKAGFVLNVENFREITEDKGKGLFVDVRIKKYPDFLKKYLGEPKSHYFMIQALELDRTIVFSLKVVKDEKPVQRFSFFQHADKRDFYYFDAESLIPDAKARLTLSLFGLDCESKYSGVTQKNEKESPLFRLVRNFPYSVDEFITIFFRELKTFGFKYTVVEQFPVVEIRIFEFPAELTLLLPEPVNAFFLLENKKFDSQERLLIMRMDRQYKNLNTVEVIIFDNNIQLKKAAADTAQKVFTELYLPNCPSYDEYGP